MEPDKTTAPQDVEEVYDIESVDKDDEEELIADKDEKTTETQDKQIIQKAQKSLRWVNYSDVIESVVGWKRATIGPVKVRGCMRLKDKKTETRKRASKRFYLVRWLDQGPVRDRWVEHSLLEKMKGSMLKPIELSKVPKYIDVIPSKNCTRWKGIDLPDDPDNQLVCWICGRGPQKKTLLCDGWCGRSFCFSCLGITETPKFDPWLCPDCVSLKAVCGVCLKPGILWDRGRKIMADGSQEFKRWYYVIQCSEEGCNFCFHYGCMMRYSKWGAISRRDIPVPDMGKHKKLSFICPSHVCTVCENKFTNSDKITCILCARAWHLKCFGTKEKRFRDFSGPLDICLCSRCKLKFPGKYPRARQWSLADICKSLGIPSCEQKKEDLLYNIAKALKRLECLQMVPKHY